MSLKKVQKSIAKNTGFKNMTKGQLFGMGMNAYFGVSSYNDAREQGHGVAMSAVRGVSETLIADVIGFKAYMGTQAVMGAPKLAVKGFTKLDQMSRDMNKQRQNNPFENANFVDTQQAYTMRQAGMQLAKAAKHSTQQTSLGNEASLMHQ